MKTRPVAPRRNSGAALVIVLAFVVLLTGVTVAMLVRSLSNGLISGASANVEKTDLYARGAISQILGDFRREIVAGSASTTLVAGSATNVLYRPRLDAANTCPTAVPCYAGPAAYQAADYTGALANWVKQSASGIPFYKGADYSDTPGPARAAASSTTAGSLNGRSISPARWNKPLLLPKRNPAGIDATPASPFVAPDWILTAADGSNPQAFAASLLGTGANPVLGRYAYVVYNEGGLLDANVAGAPSLTGVASPLTNAASRKHGPAFADLTQVGLTQAQVDTLVGWRNKGSAQSSGSYPSLNVGSSGAASYLSAILGTSGRRMTILTADLSGAAGSDQAFSTRQQLIGFLTGLDTSPSGQAALQNALPYLGTFSRTLNQPSYWPDPARPRVVGPDYGSGNLSGGNDSYNRVGSGGNDDLFNPPFRSVRVAASFTRNDGTTAKAGDPLVLKRFALNRLCWITCKGPSASLPATDPVIAKFLEEGVPQRLLDQGTAANIRKYFGLTWYDGANSPAGTSLGGYWVYDHGITFSGGTVVGLLSQVQAANREPDFFELLQAAITVGSLGKASQTGLTTGLYASPGLNTAWVIDGYTSNHILQLGANLIDQVNPTRYPTHIEFQMLPTQVFSIYGATDLPYLDGMYTCAFIARPAADGAAAFDNITPQEDLSAKDPGVGVALAVPTVWNPCDVNGPAAVAGPTNLRVCVASGTAVSIPSPSVMPPFLFPSSPWLLILRSAIAANPAGPRLFAQPLGNYGIPNPDNYSNQPPWSSSEDTALPFLYGTTFFREPTPLVQYGVPAGSMTPLPNTTALVKAGNKFGSDWSAGIPDYGDPNLGNLVGIFLGSFPLRWNAKDPDGNPVTFVVNSLQNGRTITVFNAVYRLEFQTPSGWIPYKEYTFNTQNTSLYLPLREDGSAAAPSLLLPRTGSRMAAATTMVGAYQTGDGRGVHVWDPRSNRFGLFGNCYNAPFLDAGTGLPTTGSVQTIRPGTAVGTTTAGANSIGGWTGNPVAIGAVEQNVSSGTTRYADADGVVRRAMAGRVPNPGDATALPLATATPSTTATVSNRPLVLHRPFHTVAEMGYAFRDTPWKNLDFFNLESGDAALLDAFCIEDDYRPDALEAGRVDLNGRQAKVFQAILASAYLDEAVPAAQGALPAATAATIAGALVARTSALTTAGKGPLANVADLVGRWNQGGTTAPINGATAYVGFSGDLATLLSGTVQNTVQRFQEAPMRALSGAGQAGTWNLLIDVVAQSGRYPATATSLDNFLVEGERRYWVHVAIDRQTGQIIDQSIEPVTE